MEIENCLSEKDMSRKRRTKKLRKKTRQERNHRVSIIEPKENMKIENSTNEVYNMLDLSNLSQSSQVLMSYENINQLQKDLTELEISNNNFTELSELFNLLNNLKKLVINKNTLKSLPNAVGELENLRILNLSDNQLAQLPDNLNDLKNLEILDLSNNELENLPFAYSKLQRLKELNISGNKFNSIPSCVENGLQTLRTFNISQNIDAKINIIPCSKYLERFYARKNNNCNKFPDWILTSKFFNLKEVDLEKTHFDIYRLVDKEGDLCITSLSMGCSSLTSPLLEMIIKNMVNLQKINVGNENVHKPGNILRNIPIHSLKHPQLITEMNFRATSISIVPAEIKQLYNLEKLDLGLNSITWFPEEFCELQKLQYLKIDGNGIIMLPENIGNLKCLKELRAQDNSIPRLPKSFNNLINLKYLDMYNNILEEFPEILNEMDNLQGLDFEMNYFETDDIKIGEIAYLNFRTTFKFDILDELEKNRTIGTKQKESVPSDNSEEGSYSTNYYSSENSSDEEKKEISEDESSVENWDTEHDTDDEFDPNNYQTVISYPYKPHSSTKQYLPTEPDNFCPADLHSRKIKAEVASMRAYGSLRSFKTEQGQFDDA